MTLKSIWQQYLTRADKILLLVFILLAASSYSILRRFQTPGEMVVVEAGNKIVAFFSLAEEGQYIVAGKLDNVTLQIKDKAVRIFDVSCPRKVCQQMGWIKNKGEVIVCLPNQLILRIGEQGSGDLDAVAH